MPFLLHRPDTTPTEITENDARRILQADYPDAEMQTNVWSKLLKGERVFVRPGQLEWTSTATTADPK